MTRSVLTALGCAVAVVLVLSGCAEIEKSTAMMQAQLGAFTGGVVESATGSRATTETPPSERDEGGGEHATSQPAAEQDDRR